MQEISAKTTSKIGYIMQLYGIKTVISLNIRRIHDLQWQNIISVTLNRDGDDCDGDDYFNVKMCLLFLGPCVCDQKVLKRNMYLRENINAWKKLTKYPYFLWYSAWRRWRIIKVRTRVSANTDKFKEYRVPSLTENHSPM